MSNLAVPIFPPTRPRYKNVPLALSTLLWDLTRGAPASLVKIEKRLFSGMKPPPRVSGDEFIPPDSPFVTIFNHYESERAASWWGPFLMTGVITERRTDARHLEVSRGREARGVAQIEPREDSTRIR